MDKLEKTAYKSSYFYNRELSWIKFNERVLSEAKDKSYPLFERLKFLSITASNLDEFFMVRVASIADLIDAGMTKKDIAGMTPSEQLKAMLKEIHDLVNSQYNAFNKSLLPELSKEGIQFITRHEDLSEKEGEFVDKYFMENVYPVLTPMAFDSSRPFPLILNKSLNIGALLSSKKKKKADVEFATVQVPSVLPRIILIPDSRSKAKIILLEEIIERNIDKLFLNYDVLCAHPFRITRDADFAVDEDEVEDLLKEMEKMVKKRAFGMAIRLEVADDVDKNLLKLLKNELNIKEERVFKINGPLDLTFLMKLYGLEGADDLRSPKYVPKENPRVPSGCDIFNEIRKGDILLHHPYESFNPVVEFIKQAAEDENVLAIKQTLYRVSGNSPIIAALAKAAENGKQVSVLVELKARFDEKNNIIWAKKLEKAGCHVIYGLVGLKTHSKITLVVRKEDEGIVRYVHLGTGNYNDSTAKLYTDIGLFTCSEPIGEDATAVFNMLSGYSEPMWWNRLSLAPLWLKDRFIHLINRERDNAIKGKEARIIAKVNSLCDKDMIEALYEASTAGVKIDLIVRGICCLKVGIKGVSENITVRSIVGEFLEHSRIYYFENAGSPEVYCASADWMPRNLERRVEILFPIEDEKLKEEVLEILDVLMSDNVRASFMNAEGIYEKIDRRGKESIIAHEVFKDIAKNNERKKKEKKDERVFIPKEHVE